MEIVNWEGDLGQEAGVYLTNSRAMSNPSFRMLILALTLLLMGCASSRPPKFTAAVVSQTLIASDLSYLQALHRIDEAESTELTFSSIPAHVLKASVVPVQLAKKHGYIAVVTQAKQENPTSFNLLLFQQNWKPLGKVGLSPEDSSFYPEYASIQWNPEKPQLAMFLGLTPNRCEEALAVLVVEPPAMTTRQVFFRPITSMPSDYFTAWTSDSIALFYAQSGDFIFDRIDPTTGVIISLGRQERRDGCGWIFDYCFSSDGRYLAYFEVSVITHEGDLLILDFSNGNVIKVVESKGPFFYFIPVNWPDDSTLDFAYSTPGGFDIYRATLALKPSEQLTQDPKVKEEAGEKGPEEM
jgi:hypothetical protein